MGPYCKFCDKRCFVPRIIPDDGGPWAGKHLILATCKLGMDHDRKVTGHDHKTSINPTMKEE